MTDSSNQEKEMEEKENQNEESATTRKRRTRSQSSLPTRKSPRRAAVSPRSEAKSDTKSSSEEANDDKEDKKQKSTKAEGPKSKKAKSSPKGKTKKKKEEPEPKQRTDGDGEAAASKTPTKKKKAPKHQVLTERDELPKLWTEEKAKDNGSYTFRIASWNVAGLRALLRKEPDALSNLVKEHNLDVLCLQETKLQDIHLEDPKLQIKDHVLVAEGYDAYYSCSQAKKGYSGTAVFIKQRGKKKKKDITSFFGKKSTSSTDDETDDSWIVSKLSPHKVSYKMGIDKHDQEGRLILVEFPLFSMCNVYVPNSGQKLERLKYRTEEWDKDLLAFMQNHQTERDNRPVMWLGDLNVAHTNLEVWNDGAAHLPKQAGVTAEERASFQQQLDDGDFVDAFRRLHPSAKGHYSYWSTRAGNREPNKGLRLDYFVCHSKFFVEDELVVVRDSYTISDRYGSDHCPVVIELEIRP